METAETQEVSKPVWTDQDMINAYWGGLNGSINDYSEAKTVGSELIGIKPGEGANQWLREYKTQKTAE